MSNSQTPSRLRNLLSSVDWDFKGHLPVPAVQRIHALHWYPAPFPPALVATMLDIVGSPEGSRYLDPFCGTGVGPIEAWHRGLASEGIDVNTFAIRVAKAKSTVLLSANRAKASEIVESYKEYSQTVYQDWQELSASEVCGASGIMEDALSWFELPVLREIALTKKWVLELAPQTWRRPLWVLLSSLLHRSSRLREVHYTYVVDRSQPKFDPKGDVRFRPRFEKKVLDVFRDAELFREELALRGEELLQSRKPKYRLASAEEVEMTISPGIDVVITSPPYFGMNDYVRSQYLSWLIDPWGAYERDLKLEIGARRDRTRQQKLVEYLEKLELAFKGLRNLMHDGAPLVVVAGQSKTKLSQQEDPVGHLRRRIEDFGFSLIWEKERRVLYRKINIVPFRSESIWVFQAS